MASPLGVGQTSDSSEEVLSYEEQVRRQRDLVSSHVFFKEAIAAANTVGANTVAPAVKPPRKPLTKDALPVRQLPHRKGKYMGKQAPPPPSVAEQFESLLSSLPAHKRPLGKLCKMLAAHLQQDGYQPDELTDSCPVDKEEIKS